MFDTFKSATESFWVRIIALPTVGVPFVDGVGKLMGADAEVWHWCGENRPLVGMGIVAYILWTFITWDQQRHQHVDQYKDRLKGAPKRDKKLRSRGAKR